METQCGRQMTYQTHFLFSLPPWLPIRCPASDLKSEFQESRQSLAEVLSPGYNWNRPESFVKILIGTATLPETLTSN